MLDEIGAKAVPRLLVFNKIDRAGDAAVQAEREAALRAQYPECIVMSARSARTMSRSCARRSRAFFQRDLVEAEIFLPWSAQNLRGEIFATCKVLEERTEDAGVFLRVRGEPEAVERLSEQFGGTTGTAIVNGAVVGRGRKPTRSAGALRRRK